MNNTKYLGISGMLMIIAGALVMFSENIGVGTSKILVPLTLGGSGIFALLFSRANPQHKIAKQFHFIQGAGMIIFSLVIISMANSLERFLQIVSFFLLAYGLFELMFSFSVLSSKFKIDKSILITRLLVGALNFIGAFVLIMAIFQDLKQGISIAGVLIALGGIGFLLFSKRISKH